MTRLIFLHNHIAFSLKINYGFLCRIEEVNHSNTCLTVPYPFKLVIIGVITPCTVISEGVGISILRATCHTKPILNTTIKN